MSELKALKDRRGELLQSEVDNDSYTQGFYMGLTEAIEILENHESKTDPRIQKMLDCVKKHVYGNKTEFNTIARSKLMTELKVIADNP